MPLRLVKPTQDKLISSCKLRQNQVAEIVDRPTGSKYVGCVVRRDRDRLMLIPGALGNNWLTVDVDCRVRVIPDGIIELEVFDNE